MGASGSSVINTDVIYIADGASKPAPTNVVKKEYAMGSVPPKVPEHHKVHMTKEAPMSEEAQILAIQREERKEKIKKVTDKLKQKLDALNSSVSGLDDDISNNDLITQSKNFLEDNSEKLKKQTLMLENEKAEMDEGITQMQEFIAKNKDTDVNEVNYILFLKPIQF